MQLIVSASAYRKLTAALNYTIIGLFALAVILNIAYQASYILNTNPHMPFLEADNYEYYLFAKLAIAHPLLSSSNITNPYLIGAAQGFFEHPGLYLMPVYLYGFSHLPLVWDFRILQAIAVFTIYLFSLLIVRKVINGLPVDKAYRWLAYTIVLTSFLLMQYNEIIEWRGNEFAVALSVVITYLLAWTYTRKDSVKLSLVWVPVTALAIMSIWIWSGGGIVAVPLVTALIAGLSLYSLLLGKQAKLWRYVALAEVVASVLLFFFAGQAETAISLVTSHFGFPGCLVSNPLRIGELGCLNASNGLIAVLMMLVFGAFALAAFLGYTIMSNKKKEYEYYLFGTFIAGILFLPLALVYIRLLDLIAPYFTILYALGIVAMLSYFTKNSNKLVLALTILLILISSFVGQYLFYASSMLLYSFANPAGLVNATAYMDNSTNATVLAYYAYGGYLEAYGHMRVYADTIQGLNYTKIEQIDRLFEQNSTAACWMLRGIEPQPSFILLSKNMLNSTLFANASNSSILRNPQSFNNSCGYRIEYNKSGFVVLAHAGK